MPKVRLLLIAALGLFLMHGSLAAQQQTRDQMAGTWALVSVDTVGADGARKPTYGPDPKGLLILDGSGHYSLQIRRATLTGVSSFAGRGCASGPCLIAAFTAPGGRWT